MLTEIDRPIWIADHYALVPYRRLAAVHLRCGASDEGQCRERGMVTHMEPYSEAGRALFCNERAWRRAVHGVQRHDDSGLPATRRRER